MSETPKRSKKSLLLEKEQLLKRKAALREGLPHLYGWKWYSWAREFFESTNKLNFLCAANQISKSSTQIRKCIDWATNQEKWPKLWAVRPTQFWYLYPTKDVAQIEFETKWIQFLPRGEYKNHPVYGWDIEKKNKELFALRFNSGVSVYFKTYAQEAAHLQSGTVDSIFCDEELVCELYDELMFRLSSSDGYFHMVFTATLGQDFWREVIEEKGEKERLPEAFKLQVSMFDCMKYEDGTDSHWNEDRIKIIISRCQTHAEILKRVYGRFVLSGGRKYEAFDRKINVKKKSHPFAFPKGWHVYGGVDIGSGGEKGHKAAVCFVAVSPNFREGRVFRGWRGDKIVTTASDVLTKFRELKGNMTPVLQFYDWASKDFLTIATRAGEPFLPADKSHETGEQTLNSLFGNKMLYIYDDDPELEKLSIELSSIRKDTPKAKAKDDFADALRYCVTRIPWDWSMIDGKTPPTAADDAPRIVEGDPRRGDEAFAIINNDLILEEIDEWNDAYGT